MRNPRCIFGMCPWAMFRANKACSAAFCRGVGQSPGSQKKIRRRQKCLFIDVYFTSKRRSESALAKASSCSGLAGNLPRR